MSHVRNLQKATAARFLAWLLGGRFLRAENVQVDRGRSIEDRIMAASKMIAMGKRTRALKVDAQ